MLTGSLEIDPLVELDCAHGIPRTVNQSDLKNLCLELKIDYDATCFDLDEPANAFMLSSKMQEAFERGAWYVDWSTLKVVARGAEYK